MKLARAIQIKERSQHWLPKEAHPDLIEADNLSIEALKFREKVKSWYPTLLPDLLPGETTDHCKFCGLAHTGIECPNREGEK